MRSTLVENIRNSADQIIPDQPGKLSELIFLFEGKKWRIFHRIALHLIRISGNLNLISKSLTNRPYFEDENIRHEYYLLAKQYFKDLKDKDKRKILSWIEKGPEKDELDNYKNNRKPNAAQVRGYKESWQRDRLAIFENDLPSKLKTKLIAGTSRWTLPPRPNPWPNPKLSTRASSSSTNCFSISSLLAFRCMKSTGSPSTPVLRRPR